MKITRQLADKKAFSLVELSIVLVILGLLVGGVLSGQSLIRAAELRSITSEYQRYTTAIGTFRDKYFALPGDMNNAQSFWPSTTNGTGNGVIVNDTTPSLNEINLFWVHMSLGQLIEGSFTATGVNVALTPGTNNPRARLSNASWNIGALGSVSVAGISTPSAGDVAPDPSNFYAGSYGHALLFGSFTSANGALFPGPVLKSEEAWNIDTKIDDSRPDIGTVTTLERHGSATAGSGCGNLATSTSALAAVAYDLRNTAAACSLVFKSGY